MANFDLAIDLGSDFISVISKTDNVLVKQYNLVALNKQDETQVLACGNTAAKLFKHNPGKVRLVRAIEECNVKNKDWFNCYFNWLFTIVNESAFQNQSARLLCVVPSGASANEKKTLETFFINLGAKVVVFVESPKAIAKLVKEESKINNGIMVDVGSTIADFGCFIDGNMTNGCSLYLGGRQIDVGIKQFIQEQYNVHVDLSTAEKIKKQCSLLGNNVGHVFVEGTNYLNQRIEKIEVPVRSLYDIVAYYINKYCGIIKSMVRSSDVDTAEKLKLAGIYLCGGLSQLEGIDEYISRITEINVKVSQYGANAVIYGARLMLEDKVFAR